MKSLLVLAALLLGGCASMSPQARYTEAAYDALLAVDAGQTVTIAREPWHYHEAGMPTAACIGREPSIGAAYGFMIATGVVHFAVTRWIDEQDDGSGAWHIASRVWQSATLGLEASTVAANFSIGIRPW